ncbi:MAG: CPBP family intramembrane metalloprotease [Candidatus Heimdallarchaeota archaeon]|nr:CPBP family intramembrane metalloprotease [Candidatus Heimdallarchaeota archaeon]
MKKELLKKYQILWYIIISYTIVSVITLIQVLTKIPFFTQDEPTTAGFFLLFFYAFSPTIAAIIVTSIANGKNGLKELLKGYIIWRVKWIWYIAALLLLLAPLLVGTVYYFIGDAPGIDLTLTAGTVVYIVVFGLFSGPVSEEAGWRRFMLQKMQTKYNALVSSLILGLVWFAWHIPLFFIEGTSQYLMRSSIISIIIYFVLVMAIGLILTWLYNNTKGSLIITILGHFCFNFSSVLIISMLGLMPDMVFNIVGGVLGVSYLAFILIYAGYRKFSRKPIDELPFIPLWVNKETITTQEENNNNKI